MKKHLNLKHGIRFRIDKANTMADENAAVSLGNVRLKTNLK